MGVPGLYVWLLKNFHENKMISIIPVKNVSTIYIDANCLFHPQCKMVIDFYNNNNLNIDIDKLEKKMFIRIQNYLNYIFDLVNPNTEIFIAVDGSAPIAKINQQRKRRARAVDDIEIRNKIKLKHKRDIGIQWSNTKITPGTQFMESLHQSLLNYIKVLGNRKKIKITYSSFHTFGEGEHKILNDIRNKNFNINDNIVIYGLDADLIFLSLACNKNNIYLLRETSEFTTRTTINNNKIIDIEKDVNEKLTFLSIDSIKTCYIEHLESLLNKNINKNDYTKYINDFIVLCYFLGNDFLPHFPTLDIKNNGLDILLESYVKTIINNDDIHIINNVYQLNQKVIINILNDIGDYIKPKKNAVKRLSNTLLDDYQKEIWDMDNLQNINIYDPIELNNDNMDMCKFKYYEHYFGVCEYQQEYISKMCHNYIEGLVWTTIYYFKGNQSWLWQYNFSHCPFISDLVTQLLLPDYNIDSITFDNNNNQQSILEPLSPCIQLLAVLPKQCSHELPNEYKHLVLDMKSPIADMFPSHIKLDLIGKNMLWQGVPMIPRLNPQRIIDATKNIKLSEKTKKLNMILNNFIIN